MWKKIKKKIFPPSSPAVDYLLVGLGNPGKKYEKTAHNVGFRVLSFLQEKKDLPTFTRDGTINALVSEGEVEDKKVALIVPLTFMNLSGESVKRAVKKYHLPADRVIVIHDETDLPIGTVRFCSSRGSAGHKGVASVIRHLQTKDFHRVRVGVSKEKEKAIDVVLKNMPSSMSKIEERVTEEIISSLNKDFTHKTINLIQKNTS